MPSAQYRGPYSRRRGSCLSAYPSDSGTLPTPLVPAAVILSWVTQRSMLDALKQKGAVSKLRARLRITRVGASHFIERVEGIRGSYLISRLAKAARQPFRTDGVSSVKLENPTYAIRPKCFGLSTQLLVVSPSESCHV